MKNQTKIIAIIFISLNAITLINSCGASNSQCKPNSQPKHLKIIFMGDSQLQTRKATGIIPPLRTQNVDKIINVAIRPPALELADRTFLNNAISKTLESDADIAIFLGDGLANGCADEAHDFFTELEKLQDTKPVFFVIGNHDYLANGITSNNAIRASSCGSNNTYLTKLDIIKMTHEFNVKTVTKHRGKIKNYKTNYEKDTETFCKKGLMHEQLGCYYAAVISTETANIILTDTSDYYNLEYLSPQNTMKILKNLLTYINEAVNNSKEKTISPQALALKYTGINLIKIIEKFVTKEPVDRMLLKAILDENKASLDSMEDFAAVRGYISYGDKISQIEWLKNNIEKDKKISIFASHYPTEDLTPKSSKVSRIGEIMNRETENIWVSAHRHAEETTSANYLIKDSPFSASGIISILKRDTIKYTEHVVGSVLEHNPHMILISASPDKKTQHTFKTIDLSPSEDSCKQLENNLKNLNQNDTDEFKKTHGIDTTYQKTPNFEQYYEDSKNNLEKFSIQICKQDQTCKNNIYLCLGSYADQYSETSDN